MSVLLRLVDGHGHTGSREVEHEARAAGLAAVGVRGGPGAAVGRGLARFFAVAVAVVVLVGCGDRAVARGGCGRGHLVDGDDIQIAWRAQLILVVGNLGGPRLAVLRPRAPADGLDGPLPRRSYDRAVCVEVAVGHRDGGRQHVVFVGRGVVVRPVGAGSGQGLVDGHGHVGRREVEHEALAVDLVAVGVRGGLGAAIRLSFTVVVTVGIVVLVGFSEIGACGCGRAHLVDGDDLDRVELVYSRLRE